MKMIDSNSLVIVINLFKHATQQSSIGFGSNRSNHSRQK